MSQQHLSHRERVDVARSAIDYIITSPSPAQLEQPVPNCPGWTVYNAAVHVGRVCVAWEQMMGSAVDDATARDRAYEHSNARPAGAEPAELARWAHSAIEVTAGERRDCFFSMTGGPGDTELWAWHAASEIGVHRLDVEDALGQRHEISDRAAADSVRYACGFFLPAMRRVSGINPGGLTAELLGGDGEPVDVVEITPADDAGPDTPSATISGPAVQVLLALWGRPYDEANVRVTGGDAGVLSGWRELPATSFQFGTWE